MDNQNKEIDLIEVFNKLITKINKNKILFISVIIVFIILGFVYNSTQKETYTLSTIATSSINKEVLLKFINDLNNKNSKGKKIISKLENILFSYDDDDDKRHIYNLDLILNDTTDVDNTIDKFKQQISDINYVKNIILKEKTVLKLRIKNYNDEIQKIDSIQNLVFKENNSKSTIISTNGLSKTKIEFQDKIINLTTQLNKVAALSIINNKFNYFTSNKNEFKNIIIFIFLGFFVGLIIVLIKS